MIAHTGCLLIDHVGGDRRLREMYLAFTYKLTRVVCLYIDTASPYMCLLLLCIDYKSVIKLINVN